MSTNLLHPDVLALLGALAGLAESTAPPPASRPAIACTLNTAERRARQEEIRRDLLPRVREVTEEPTGYVLWFDRTDGEIQRVASFVELESQCCAFLDFSIRLESGGRRIALHLGGPEGTKEFLRPLVEKTLDR